MTWQLLVLVIQLKYENYSKLVSENNLPFTFRKLLASSVPMLSPASETPLKASSRVSIVEELARAVPVSETRLEELAEGGAWFSDAQSCSITTSTVLPSLENNIHAENHVAKPKTVASLSLFNCSEVFIRRQVLLRCHAL